MDRRRFLGTALAGLAAMQVPLRRAPPATVPIAFWGCHRDEGGWLVTKYFGTFRLPNGVDPELGKLYIDSLRRARGGGEFDQSASFIVSLTSRYQREPLTAVEAKRLPSSQQWWCGQVPAHLRGRDDPLCILPARRDGVA